jgi:glucose-6-phosphate isomerase
MSLNINLNFFFDPSFGCNLKSTEEYKKNLDKCCKASEKLILEIKEKSNEIVNSFNLDYQNKIELIKKKIKKKNKQLVIGMGGSASGAKAIKMYLGHDSIFFLDNYDPEYLSIFFSKNNLNDFTIYIISKSGNTFETLAILNLLFQYLLKISILEEVKKNIIIVTEESESLLNNFAKKNNLQIVHHNKNIGGRFSVFSETAMILFDLEVTKIANGAEAVVSKLFSNNLEDSSNPVVNAAVILSLQEKYGIHFNANLLYDYTLKDFSYWFHQLFSESLGKNNNALTPITSICPKDHHSSMQLFIDGPKNKLFNIYPPRKSGIFSKFSSLGLGDIESKTPDRLLESQYLGLVKTFKNLKIPHRIINTSVKEAERISNIFELFSYNILETIILGYAQNLNPYNQPAVEQIKLNTFNL